MVKKPVYQYELDGKFVERHESIAAAAGVMGCDEALIRTAIKRGGTSCGFKWADKTVFTEISKVPDRYLEQPEIIENLIKYGTEYDPKDVAFRSCGVLDNILEGKVLNPKFKNKTIPAIKGAKILLLDIETAPLRAYVWSLWKQNVGLSQIISDFFILTWSAKWLGETTIISERLTGFEALKETDCRIVKELWTLLDDADVVIAHNGDKFDIPKVNSRFVIHGLTPPSPYKTIDTLLIARKQFGFTSNRLQHLATSFKIEGKYDTTFDLWVRCLQGDEEALEYMEYYNKHDVGILEKVYLKLRPFAKGHANLDLYFDDATPHCPICGKHNLILVPDKSFYTQAIEYQVYRCEDCGGLSRAKKGNKMLNKKVISAIPR